MAWQICDEHFNLRKQIDRLTAPNGARLCGGVPFTMARFWFFNQDARTQITARLQSSQGRILPDEELERFGRYFPIAISAS